MSQLPPQRWFRSVRPWFVWWVKDPITSALAVMACEMAMPPSGRSLTSVCCAMLLCTSIVFVCTVLRVIIPTHPGQGLWPCSHIRCHHNLDVIMMKATEGYKYPDALPSVARDAEILKHFLKCTIGNGMTEHEDETSATHLVRGHPAALLRIILKAFVC